MSVPMINRSDVRSWKPRSGPRFTLPDGSVLQVSGGTASLDEPWFAECRIGASALSHSSGGSGFRAFQTGPLGTIDGHVLHLLQGQFVAEYSATGGRYLIASAPDGSAGLVAWRGRWHEAYCWVNDANASHETALGNLEGLAFLDTPSGLRAQLTNPAEEYLRITAVKHVPAVGFLEFTRTADSGQALPRWSGAKVRSGEVWKQKTPPEAGGLGYVLVHASPEVVTVLNPREGGDEARGLQFLAGLASVSWS
jgi:hypothetical protein